MTSSVVSNEMYVILGASGNTGSIIANSLLSAGKKVRVVGRDSGRLQRFVDKGADAFTCEMFLWLRTAGKLSALRLGPGDGTGCACLQARVVEE
jgi:short subunit dehydrogenase-like uncharacterized protein